MSFRGTGSILRETSGSASMTASSKLGSKDALKSLQEEFKKRKEEKKSALDMDVSELFKQEPSWRGQRRKKLLASRFEEADAETAIRVGKGKQELWEASRVGNFERVMELLFRCVARHLLLLHHHHHHHKLTHIAGVNNASAMAKSSHLEFQRGQNIVGLDCWVVLVNWSKKSFPRLVEMVTDSRNLCGVYAAAAQRIMCRATRRWE